MFENWTDWIRRVSRTYIYSLIAAEISSFARYYHRLIYWKPLGEEKDPPILFDAIVCADKSVIPDCVGDSSRELEVQGQSIFLVNGNLNYTNDIFSFLQELFPVVARSSRVVIVGYNPYFKYLYVIANYLGLRKASQPTTFLTLNTLANIAQMAGFEIVRTRNVCYFPFALFGLANLINKIVPTVPLLRWLCFALVVVLRPRVSDIVKPSLSIIIPARNEKGNIEGALQRIPEFPKTELEIIFVEGHSTDGTWEEINRLIPIYEHRFAISAFQQQGKGKSDAVRLGIAHSKNELIVILDADLTMPPEYLTRFYAAYTEGYGDFVLGNRLVYPMEGNAMAFLNLLGNIFFAKALDIILDVKIGDSLCGTKLFSRYDYLRFVKWRESFGDFDPFGDFELLFPAAELCLGMVDLPIPYKDRSYGATNISRFSHGLMLLQMTIAGFVKIKLGKIK